MSRTASEEYMSNDVRWISRWSKFMSFMESHHRRPSKYSSEERLMWNWFKHNKKLLNKGLLPPDRKESFEELLERAEQVQRVNQYAYAKEPDIQLKMELGLMRNHK